MLTATLTCTACRGKGKIIAINSETAHIGPICCRLCNGTGQRPGDGITPLFKLGRTVITPGAAAALPEPGDWLGLLARHVAGDWGDVGDGDAICNEDALYRGARVLSAYNVGNERIWIITEADRSATTILLPSEY